MTKIPISGPEDGIHCPGCMTYRPIQVWDNLPLAWYLTHEDDKEYTPMCDLCRSQGVWAVGHTTNLEYSCGTDVEVPIPRVGAEWYIRINALPAGMMLASKTYKA